MADQSDAEIMARRALRSKGAQGRPDMRLEAESGCNRVAGVDEAGRGPLAGPVVCAAVKLDSTAIPVGLNDSKKLTAARREELFTSICATADCGVAVISTVLIDRYNIRGATLLGMCRAVAALADPPELALIDGRDVPTDLCCQ